MLFIEVFIRGEWRKNLHGTCDTSITHEEDDEREEGHHIIGRAHVTPVEFEYNRLNCFVSYKSSPFESK